MCRYLSSSLLIVIIAISFSSFGLVSPGSSSDSSNPYGGTFTGTGANSTPTTGSLSFIPAGSPTVGAATLPGGSVGQQIVAASSSNTPGSTNAPGSANQAAPSTGKSIQGNASAVANYLNPPNQLGAQTTSPADVLIVPMTNDDVQEILIEQSAAGLNQQGLCHCPYDLNNDGFECGLECAYYRPGGFRYKCYPQDIRGQEYIYYRKTH